MSRRPDSSPMVGMSATPSNAVGCIICFLPIAVSVTKLGFLPTSATVLVLLLFRMFAGFAAFGGDKLMVLESISASHYVEIVRWSLDRLDEPYREVENVAILGVMALARLVPTLHIPRTKASLSNSTDILRFLYGKYYHKSESEFLKPVTRPEDVTLERALVKASGAFRTWVYYHTIVEPGKVDGDLLVRAWGLKQPYVPAWQKHVMIALFPVAKLFVSRMLNVNAETKREALSVIKANMDVVDERLMRTKYLLGSELSYVDIMWASSAALMFRPEEFAGGRIAEESLIRLSDLSETARKELNPLIVRPGAEFCLKLFREERGKSKAQLSR